MVHSCTLVGGCCCGISLHLHGLNYCYCDSEGGLDRLCQVCVLRGGPEFQQAAVVMVTVTVKAAWTDCTPGSALL